MYVPQGANIIPHGPGPGGDVNIVQHFYGQQTRRKVQQSANEVRQQVALLGRG
jgi:hypothetical protein